MTRILRVKDVEKITGLNKVTIWRLEKEGKFPKRKKITRRAVGWYEPIVLAWIADYFKDNDSQGC